MELGLKGRDAIHIVVDKAGNPMRRMDRQITWPDTDWAGDVTLNMIGMLRTTQVFLPLIPHDGSGRIVSSGVAATLAATEGREAWAENIAGTWATMEDVADTVVFLASDRGQYINGSQLVIDGGMSVNPRPA